MDEENKKKCMDEMREIGNRLLSFLLPILLFSSLFHFSANTSYAQDTFNQANEFYSKQNYDEANKLYLNILHNEGGNGEILHNLGNSYFRKNNLAEAIFYWRWAQEFLPRDGELKWNLDYARNRTKDKIEKKSSWPEWFTLPLSDGEYLCLLAILSISFWSFQCLYRFRFSDIWRTCRNFSAILLIISLASFGVYHFFTPPFGVIKGEVVQIHSGPRSEDVVLFELHEGSEVNVEKNINDWFLVRLGDGKRGWVHKDNLLVEEMRSLIL